MKFFFISGSLKAISTISIHRPYLDTLQEIFLLHDLKVVFLYDVCPSLKSVVKQVVLQTQNYLQDMHVAFKDRDDGRYQTKVELKVQYMSCGNFEHSIEASVFRNALKRCNDPTQVSCFHMKLQEPRKEVGLMPLFRSRSSSINEHCSVDNFANSIVRPFYYSRNFGLR